MKGEPRRFVFGHQMRVYTRPPLGEGDYLVEQRGYDSPCWIATGFRTTRGYTKVALAGRQRYAHRVAYEQAYGPIPAGLQIDHLCRQKDCIRPDHLEAVTAAENARRSPLRTRLTDAQIAAIRSDPRTTRVIGEAYGITAGYVSRVKRGLNRAERHPA